MVLRSVLAMSALAACSVSAFAADLPLRSAPSAPYYDNPPLFTWTGFYAGVNAGVGFGTDQGSVTANKFTPGNGFPLGPASGTFGPFTGGGTGPGFTGGGQVGYNAQQGIVVFGMEADIGYYGASAGGTSSFADSHVFNTPSSTFALSQGGGNGYLGTVRARLGITAYERTLLYVTGGFAYGDYGPNYTLGRFANGITTADFSAQGVGNTRVGYAIGAGVEYAITPHITAKAEYIYADIGSRSYQLVNPNTNAVFNATSSGQAQLARVGVNYKF